MREDRKNITDTHKNVVLWGSAFLFVANLWISSVVFGVVTGLAWAILVTSSLAQNKKFGSSELERYVFASLFAVSLFGVALVAGYLATSLSFTLIASLVLGVTFTSSIMGGVPSLSKVSITKSHWTNPLVILIVFADLWIIWQAIEVSTSSALSSPWELFGVSIFLLFGFTSFLLILMSYHRRDDLSIALTMLHFFVAVSISAIVFKIGFGFDPYIHRAAELELATKGFIEPKQILYSGQYVLVSAMHRLTSVPIHVIDVWLVPIVSSLLIPLAAYLGLSNARGIKKSEARTWMHVIFLLPFMALTFTVPFNITFALFFATIFLLLIKYTRLQWIVHLMLSVFAVVIHPLLGVPMLLLVAMATGWKRWLVALVSVAVLPAMFMVHNLEAVTFLNPFSKVLFFANLFIDPYQHNFFPIPAVWEWIYVYRSWIVWALLGLVIFGAYKFKAKRRSRTYLVSGASFMLGVFFLSTMFVFKGIIWYEQAEFSFRLIQAISLLVLPFVALYGVELVRDRSDKVKYAVFSILAIAMTFSWYFSYPRLDPKSVTPGVSVGGSDVEVVHIIDDLAEGERYIVLSSQMTSAAALQEFGFRDYIGVEGEEYLWYALPTGGVLYQEFLSYLGGGADRAVIDQINAGTGVDTIFVVIHKYTPGSESLMAEARLSADASFSVGDVVLFKYSY